MVVGYVGIGIAVGIGAGVVHGLVRPFWLTVLVAVLVLATRAVGGNRVGRTRTGR